MKSASKVARVHKSNKKKCLNNHEGNQERLVSMQSMSPPDRGLKGPEKMVTITVCGMTWVDGWPSTHLGLFFHKIDLNSMLGL